MPTLSENTVLPKLALRKRSCCYWETRSNVKGQHSPTRTDNQRQKYMKKTHLLLLILAVIDGYGSHLMVVMIFVTQNNILKGPGISNRLLGFYLIFVYETPTKCKNNVLLCTIVRRQPVSSGVCKCNHPGLLWSQALTLARLRPLPPPPPPPFPQIANTGALS